MTQRATQLQSYLAEKNITAFLAMLRSSEGATYNTLFGGKTFEGYNTHPTDREIPSPKGYTTYTNKAGVTIKTSAAGAYQITYATWESLETMLGLTDFSPRSQDIGALELIREKGAIPLIRQGLFEEAVEAVCPIWASLPGSNNNQPEHDMATVQAWYIDAGGELAG